MKARLLLLASAVLFSTGGAAVKGAALTAWQVAAGRSLIAAIVVLLILPETRRGWRWQYVPVAASYAATMVLYVLATKLTTAANAIFLQAAAPLFVMLLSPLVLKEPIRRSDVVLMIAVAFGMTLVFSSHQRATETAPDPARGDILGGLSAVTWALTIVGLRAISRHAPAGSNPSLSTVSLGNLIATSAALPWALPLPKLELANLAVISWLGIFQVALAYVFLTRGIRSAPALEASILLLLDPALNPVWTWLVHGEKPAGLSIAGGLTIFLAILAVTIYRSQRASRTS